MSRREIWDPQTRHNLHTKLHGVTLQNTVILTSTQLQRASLCKAAECNKFSAQQK